MTEPTTITRDVLVRCARQHAFHVFTARIDLWWPPTHRHFESGSTLRMPAGVGGEIIEESANGEVFVFGEVLEWAPPERLVYRWVPGGDTGPTEVSVAFVEVAPAETRVEIRHRLGASAAASWPKRAVRFAAGWDLVLPAFVAEAGQVTP